VNLKKGLPWPGTCPQGQKHAVAERHDSSADSRKAGFCRKNRQARQLHSICVGGSLWAIFGVDACALTLLRGPIRRRPYNRGEIVAKKCAQLLVFNDFY
jgi:hypothetical protein